MGIHSMGLTMGLTIGLPMASTIAINMALIAVDLVAMALTLGPSILYIWVTLALFSKIAKLATEVASISYLPSTMIRLALFLAM